MFWRFSMVIQRASSVNFNANLFMSVQSMLLKTFRVRMSFLLLLLFFGCVRFLLLVTFRVFFVVLFCFLFYCLCVSVCSCVLSLTPGRPKAHFISVS